MCILQETVAFRSLRSSHTRRRNQLRAGTQLPDPKLSPNRCSELNISFFTNQLQQVKRIT